MRVVEEEKEEEEKTREGLKTGGAHIKNTRPIRSKEKRGIEGRKSRR